MSFRDIIEFFPVNIWMDSYVAKKGSRVRYENTSQPLRLKIKKDDDNLVIIPTQKEMWYYGNICK